MDYGKMAYMRSDDLAKRIAVLERAATAAYGSVLWSSRESLEIGQTKTLLNSLTAAVSGVCQMILRLRVNSGAGGGLLVRLNCGEEKIVNETVELPSGARDAFFLVSREIDRGKVEVGLELQGQGFTLESFDLAAFGCGMQFSNVLGQIYAGANGVLLHRDGMAKYFPYEQLQQASAVLSCEYSSLVTKDGSDYIVFVHRRTAFCTAAENFCPKLFALDASAAIATDTDSGFILRDGKVYRVDGGAVNFTDAAQGRVTAMQPVIGYGGLIIGVSGGRVYLKRPMPSASAGTVTVGGAV